MVLERRYRFFEAVRSDILVYAVLSKEGQFKYNFILSSAEGNMTYEVPLKEVLFARTWSKYFRSASAEQRALVYA